MVFGLGGDGFTLLVSNGADAAPFGILAAVVTAHPVSDERFCEELVWFIEPTERGATMAGVRMLRMLDEWARARGARYIKMVCPHGSKVGGFYERAGYQPLETAYMKRLV
jgi:GNAT superfamily N-acetyltransferase